MPELINIADLPKLTEHLGKPWMMVRIGSANGCIPGVKVIPVEQIGWYGTHEHDGSAWLCLKNPDEYYNVAHSIEELHSVLIQCPT